MKQLLLLILTCYSSILAAQQTTAWGNWQQWGDLGNGTYRNPVIPADYSDIDCIRVDDDYYAISSTFQFSPGMTLLHSKDLVNWRICTNIIDDLTQISPELDWNRMDRYGRGVWAGTLRHHDGRFHLFFGTPDEGYFSTSSPTPEGPWDPLTPLLTEAGWDDCTALWDKDGKAYFAGTHFADGYKTYLFTMSPDGKSIDRQSAILINEGSGREASKLFEHNGFYYLIFSEHKEGMGRYVMAKRAQHPTGPYSEEKQLTHPCREAMEPNQGGMVSGQDNRWYFLTHHGTGDWSGRIVSLLPINWIDGWPIPGTVVAGNIGSMQWTSPMPFTSAGQFTIRRNDDFDSPQLDPHWQWNYQPRKEYYSLDERPGWLRLKAFRPLQEDNLLKAGNTLTQRTFRTQSNTVTIKMDITHMGDGQRAGLCHFSSQHSGLGIAKEEGICYLEYRQNGHIQKGSPVTQTHVWLRTSWGNDGLSTYSYSLNGDHFYPFGTAYQMVWGNYRGDRIGIYCFNNKNDEGSVDIDYLHYW